MLDVLDPIMPYVPYIAGLAAATTVYIILEWMMRRLHFRLGRDRVARFVEVEGEIESEVAIGSKESRIRLASQRVGLDVVGREQQALLIAKLLLGMILALIILWLGFPPMTMVMGWVIAWFTVDSYVDGTWIKMRHEIENEIPTFLSRMSGTVQAEPNVLLALEEVTNTLRPGGPLQVWMRRFTSRISTGGRPAFRPLLEEAESISPALGLTVFEIGRLWETGGEGYARAFARASENLMNILDGRVQAYAKAEGAKSAIRVVLGALVLVAVFMLRNPSLAQSMRSPLVQILYLVIALWVMVGWGQVNSMIEEVSG